jgi:hypothetical protein
VVVVVRRVCSIDSKRELVRVEAEREGEDEGN